MQIPRRCSTRIATIAVCGLFVACASLRDFEVAGDGPRIAAADDMFYVVVNDASEIVDYNFFAVPLDYDSYAAWRVPVDAKLHVPVEIVRFLDERGKKVKMGPGDTVPKSDAVIIRYEELWGWDMGFILKKLSIEMSKAATEERATVSFDEMSIFNTHPTAASLVPQMMRRLFGTK